MKIFYFILFLILILFLISSSLKAQQVKKNDCCQEVATKATITVNNNESNTTNTTNIINGGFNFQLNTSSRTSAGVFNSTGALLRTLWSGTTYDIGCYNGQWDGYLDDGVTIAATGDYTIKVLTNNVKYEWLGVIGNTSASLYNHIFGNFGGFTALKVVGNKAFYGFGFYEGGLEDTNNGYFSLDNIQSANNITGIPGAIVCDYATDGVNVYHAMADQYSYGIPHMNYIYATKASDNSIINFSAGISHQTGRDQTTYPGLIGFKADGDIQYSGIAVNNNFIFATRKDENKLYVFNKTTGSQVQALTYASAGKMAVTSDGYLWLVYNSKTEKFKSNNDGTLTSTGIVLTTSNPVSISVSPDNSTVTVSDVGTQNIKSFNNSTGSALWVLGQAGGYATNGPDVTNDKFDFYSNYATPFVTYQPDGSFWFNDCGNYRLLHFNSDRTLKEKISYIPASRSCNVDPNNPTRIFADELEFALGYTKVLDNGTNGSWKLAKNWRAGTNLDIYRKFTQVVTLSNGHTYASGDNTLYDLTNTGAVLLSNSFSGNIEADGSLWYRDFPDNDHVVQYKKLLTRFDNNNMPQWGPPTTIATTPSFSTNPDQPVYYTNNTLGSSTNPRKFFFYSEAGGKFNGIPTGNGYRLGAVNIGGNTWNWQSAHLTPNKYQGQYPQNGWYDYTGNNANCMANVNGSNVFYHANGELGRFTETCWTSHFDESGLFIGIFGSDKVYVNQIGNSAFLAGNSFKTQLAKVGNDLYYFYCDEGVHSGVHVTKVSNLSSIQVQSIPVTVSAAISPWVADASDMMASLPSELATSFSGNSDWIIDNPSGFSFGVNYRSFGVGNKDVAIGTSNNAYVKRKLANTTMGSYQLSGKLEFSGQPTFHDGIACYLDLTDQAGKVIARFQEKYDYASGEQYHLVINSTTIPGSLGSNPQQLKLPNSFSYSYSNGALVFKIGGYPAITLNSPFETGANLAAPGFLAVKLQGQYGNQYHEADLFNLRFSQ